MSLSADTASSNWSNSSSSSLSVLMPPSLSLSLAASSTRARALPTCSVTTAACCAPAWCSLSSILAANVNDVEKSDVGGDELNNAGVGCGARSPDGMDVASEDATEDGS